MPAARWQWGQDDFRADPPQQWQTDEVMVNRHVIETAPELRRGRYRLVAGAYA